MLPEDVIANLLQKGRSLAISAGLGSNNIATVQAMLLGIGLAKQFGSSMTEASKDVSGLMVQATILANNSVGSNHAALVQAAALAALCTTPFRGHSPNPQVDCLRR